MKNEQESEQGFIAIIALVIIAVIGIAILGVALNIITIPWHKLNSQVQLNHDLIDKTYNADNALYNYHWFQERAGAIRALKTTIEQSQQALTDFEASAGNRKDWTFEDKTEDARLRSVVQGQQAQYQSFVEEYNAKAQEADRSIFKDELPLFFSLSPFGK